MFLDVIHVHGPLWFPTCLADGAGSWQEAGSPSSGLTFQLLLLFRVGYFLSFHSCQAPTSAARRRHGCTLCCQTKLFIIFSSFYACSPSSLLQTASHPGLPAGARGAHIAMQTPSCLPINFHTRLAFLSLWLLFLILLAFLFPNPAFENLTL